MSPPTLPWACKPLSSASWAAVAPHKLIPHTGAEQTCKRAMLWGQGTGPAVWHVVPVANLQQKSQNQEPGEGKGAGEGVAPGA